VVVDNVDSLVQKWAEHQHQSLTPQKKYLERTNVNQKDVWPAALRYQKIDQA
jgi:hypothetical protein